MRRQYRRLAAALPFVRFHYAVKALAHAEVLGALADEGCGFDVATGDELELLDGIDRDRIIHTHPIKKASEIAEALEAGVRTFVIDNEVELDKFAAAPADVRLLIRLAYRSPHAKSDLSTKFGVGPFEAEHLVDRALERGIRIGGFSFHVGSQLDDPARFAAAITETLALMDHLESSSPVRFETLDIGGGFPVGVRHGGDAARRPRRGHPPAAGAAGRPTHDPRRAGTRDGRRIHDARDERRRHRRARRRPLVLPRRRPVRRVLERAHRGRAPADLRRARDRRARHGCRHAPLGDARRTDVRLDAT